MTVTPFLTFMRRWSSGVGPLSKLSCPPLLSQVMNGTGLRQFMTDMPCCGRPRKPRPLRHRIQLNSCYPICSRCWRRPAHSHVTSMIWSSKYVPPSASSPFSMMISRWRVLSGLPMQTQPYLIPFMLYWARLVACCNSVMFWSNLADHSPQGLVVVYAVKVRRSPCSLPPYLPWWDFSHQ